MSQGLFDVYVPTRTLDGFEVRVRSEVEGAVSMTFGAQSFILDAPSQSHDGCHFYRRRFEGFLPGSSDVVRVESLTSGAFAAVEAGTLERPPGPLKLRIGVLSDLHLPPVQAGIEQYGPGTRRLCGLGEALAADYIRRLEALGADLIVLPGDLVDPCTERTLDILKRILGSVSIPCCPVIGNHEPCSEGGEARFFRALGLPAEGFYTFSKNGVRILLLSTPDPSALSRHAPQRRRLETALAETPRSEDIVLVSHFSLLLHPCTAGHRNDGYQLLDDAPSLLALLRRFPNVRLFIAGHKNVPSMVMDRGIVHTLSPQLIQYPCSYDLFHLFDGGLTRSTFEIDEQHYLELARKAHSAFRTVRYGTESGRNFSVVYTDR